ncbi:hypothetical protein D3C81_1079910 [compost metagenome]
MNLVAARHDVAHALGDHSATLVIVGLMQKSTTRIDVAPEVERRALANLAQAGNQRLGVEHFRDVVAPGQRVERTQQVRHEGRARAFAGVAGSAGELAEHRAGRVADDIRILELGNVVLVVVIGRAVTASLSGRVGHAHRPDFQPRVFAGVAVARYHRIGDVVAHLDGGANRAAEGRAVQPVADSDHAVFEAVGGQRRRDDGGGVQGERRCVRAQQQRGGGGAQTPGR